MSLGITLLAMVPLCMSLNRSTLIGLLLSMGRLVEDSIIDVHSIERHLRMGKSSKEAAVDGITEVQVAVLAIALPPADNEATKEAYRSLAQASHFNPRAHWV